MKHGFRCVVWGSLASMLYAGPRTSTEMSKLRLPADTDAAVAQTVVVTRPNMAPAQLAFGPLSRPLSSLSQLSGSRPSPIRYKRGRGLAAGERA
jgi:hypothetical protein